MKNHYLPTSGVRTNPTRVKEHAIETVDLLDKCAHRLGMIMAANGLHINGTPTPPGWHQPEDMARSLEEIPALMTEIEALRKKIEVK